jgi:WXXGXW repeat (2 copies)
MKPHTSANTPSYRHSPLLQGARAAFGAAALTSLLALTSGCVVAVRPAPVATVYSEPGEVVVDAAPPAPLYETVGVSPGPGFLWIGGYYHWSGARWVWNRGHFERPPHPGAAWIRPRYEVRGGRSVYVRGYWR